MVVSLGVAACGAPGVAEPSSTTRPAATTIATPSTSTSVESTTTPPAGGISTGELGVIVPPDENGEYPPDLVVTCAGSGEFPLSAVNDIRPLEEADPGGIAEAIEPFLDSEEGQYWPQEGWQILHQSPEQALLVAREQGSLTFMHAVNDGSGWSWAGSGGGGESCPLEFPFPEEINAVSWILDPAAPPPNADSTEIAVILNERPCVGGREIGDRLLPPEIVTTESRVFLAFAAERPPGDAFECPGNPDMPYVVRLPEPLGDRTLMEGVELGIDLADYVD